MKTVEDRIKLAQSATGEDLWKLVRDQHPGVISAVVFNRNFSEEMSANLAKRKSTPADVLGMLAQDIRFRESYKLKLALCRNPKTPQKITLGLLKFLRIFDLGDLTKNQNIPINIRQKIEYSINEKIPSLPSGTRIALAKRASSNVVILLMEQGEAKVIGTCLESPVLTEGHITKIISKTAIKPLVIKMIAESPKWSARYYIKYALIRNNYTPMVHVVRFVRSMKTADLKDLYADTRIPSVTRPFIFRELLDRKETVNIGKEETFNLSEDDEDAFIAENDLPSS